MKESFILVIQDKKNFINIEFISEGLNKKLYINNDSIILKNREIEVFYLLAKNINEIVSKEDIIRVLLEKKNNEKLLDIDIKYSNNRVSEVIGKIEKILCNMYDHEYIKNSFIQRKSRQGYFIDSNAKLLKDKNLIKAFFDDTNKINDFYYKYKNSDFIKDLKTFISYTNNYNEYLEEAPQNDLFYGREEEIITIKEKLTKYNLVCLYGAGGIGKTALAKQVVNQIKTDFEVILWKDLKNIPSIETLIEDLLYKITQQKEVINNNNIKANIDNFINKIKLKKTLLILDNFEAILDEKDLSGTHKDNFRHYKYLLDSLYLNVLLGSKTIVTSRERPEDFRLMKEKVSSIKLEWLDYKSCHKILLRYGIVSDKNTINQFIYTLGGNPQLINMISHTIKKVFLGNLDNFLNINSNLNFDIYHFLDEQFEKISDIEKKIMFTLIIPRHQVSFHYLFEELSTIPKIDIINSIEVLIDKAFISVNENIIDVQTVVMEYFTKKLNSIVASEISECKPDILKRYMLVLANENSTIIDAQKKYFILEIIRLLLETLDINQIQEKINKIIFLRTELSVEQQSILNSNIINLLLVSGLELKNFNFKNTFLKNLYLKDIDLKDVSFEGNHFDNNVFFNELGMSSSYDISTTEQSIVFNIKNEIYKYFLGNNRLEKIHLPEMKDEIKILKLSKDNSLLVIVSNEKEMLILDMKKNECIFNSKVINIDAAKVFFSNNNKHLLIYSFEGIEIYNIETGLLLCYINDPSIKFCYDLKLFDSFPFLVMIKNDLNIYWFDYLKPDQQIIKTNISDALFLDYNQTKNEFIIIHSNKEISVVSDNFNTIFKTQLEINKNEIINNFFIDEITNKLFIFGSKVWVLSADEFRVIHIIDIDIKNLQTSGFFYDKNQIAFLYNDFKIDILDLNMGKKVKSIKGINKNTTSIEKNLSYLYLLLFGSSDISLFSLKDMRITKTIKHKYSAIIATTNSKNTLLALYNIEKSISLFDLNKNKFIKTIPIKENNTFCLDLNEDASILAYKDNNKLIFLDTIDYSILYQMDTDSNNFTKSFKFSLSNNDFICFDNEHILIVEMNNFTSYKFKVPYKIIDFICIDETLYSISNNEFFITNIKNGEISEYLLLSKKINGIAYSDNLENIFLISEYIIYIFNIKLNKIVNEIKTNQHLYAVQSHNNILFGINIDGCIDYFDLNTAKLIKSNIIPRTYENFNIKNTTGLSRFQKEVLNSLGSLIQ